MPRALALGLLLAFVSLSSAFLLSTGLSAQRLPEFLPEDLGKPFKGSSVSGVKAIRDFEMSDEAKTLELRQQARARIKPVFDYDPSIETHVINAVRVHFSHLREVAASQKSFETIRKNTEKTHSKEETEFLEVMRLARPASSDEIILPDDEDFVAMSLARFSQEIENAANTLLEQSYQSKVVASRDELTRVNADGIVVRVLGGGSEFELTRNSTAVFDLRESAAELDRYSSVPGNFLPDSPIAIRRAVLRFAKRQLRANLTVNIAETEARKAKAFDAVKPVIVSIKRGKQIIGDGETITAQHILLINGLKSQRSELDVLQLQLGAAGLVALLIAVSWFFFSANVRGFSPSRRDAVFLAVLSVGLLAGLHTWVLLAEPLHDRYPHITAESLQMIFPLSAGAMLVRFVLSKESSLYFLLVISILSAIMLGNSLTYCALQIVTSLVAVAQLQKAKTRVDLFRAGFVTSIVGSIFLFLLSVANGKGVSNDSIQSSAALAVSMFILVPLVVLMLTPVAETVFGYASDFKLLELANLNHPALKELVLNAPGTYHHSIVVGSLVEAASESIGANALLARSCAYYHDIGKGRNPTWFGENQKNENPHDTSKPSESASIIRQHVLDGLALARQYKIPRRVADAIPENHGTRFVGFFFQKAQKTNERPNENDFRYAGPKPQSKETALVMIADACEAASRNLGDADSEQLGALVLKMINLIFSEGQLDECDLTLKDLHVVSQSFTQTLAGIHRARPNEAAAGPPRASNEVVKLSVVKESSSEKSA
jgi:cyclic-di-AMP phosphodiesterase PgpH